MVGGPAGSFSMLFVNSDSCSDTCGKLPVLAYLIDFSPAIAGIGMLESILLTCENRTQSVFLQEQAMQCIRSCEQVRAMQELHKRRVGEGRLWMSVKLQLIGKLDDRASALPTETLV